MSIRALKKWALLLTFWVAMQSKYLKAAPITGDTVTGDFTATGNADIQGGTLTLGMRSDNSNPGWQSAYTDGSNAYVDFEISRSSGIWRWWQNGGASLQLQLTLDNNNTLTLFDQSSTPVPKITLNPLGTSTFANSVTLNGTGNEMPNQTLVNGSSVLTESLADGRYVLSSYVAIGQATYMGTPYKNIGILGGSSSAASSFAEGSGSTASGYASTAMGANSTASGLESTAIGTYDYAVGVHSTAIGVNSRATGLGSTAIGVSSTASGSYATALGFLSTASGQGALAAGSSTASGSYSVAGGKSMANANYSTAMGASTASGMAATATGQSIASGSFSTASGYFTTAQAYDSFAIGTYNVGGGDPYNWVATDPIFEIGNGIAGVPGTSASGGYWSSSPEPGWTTWSSYSGYYIPPQSGIPGIPTVYSDAFVVYKNGNTAVQGTLTTGGAITTSGTITTSGVVKASTFMTTVPTGDIPMYTGH